MQHLRLFLIGIFMGIADLIPGISGGTVAFICGIYQDLLDAIKSLQFQSSKKIAWLFILTLGSGIAFSLLCFSKPIYSLLLLYPLFVNALFFGLIGGSAYFFFRKASLKKPFHIGILILSFLGAYILSGTEISFALNVSPLTLFFAGALGACALLLPGISGSYVLHLLGVYPLILFSLSHLFEKGSFQILLFLALGITFGLIIFSRLISWLLKLFYQTTLAVMIGLMVGGMRTLWPFVETFNPYFLLLILIGFLATLLLEKIAKKPEKNILDKQRAQIK